MSSYATKLSQYAYPGDRCEIRAMISISLLIGRRDRKRINGSINHAVVKAENNIDPLRGSMFKMSRYELI